MGYYLYAGITLLSAFLGTGFSVGLILRSKGKDRENALYLFARSLALTGTAVVPICIRGNQTLMMITAAMLLVQIIDGMIGVMIKSRMRTIGPFMMAFCHLICLFALNLTE